MDDNCWSVSTKLFAEQATITIELKTAVQIFFIAQKENPNKILASALLCSLSTLFFGKSAVL